ncbi:hypothetical protein [Rhodopirellula bahusiensis]
MGGVNMTGLDVTGSYHFHAKAKGRHLISRKLRNSSAFHPVELTQIDILARKKLKSIRPVWSIPLPQHIESTSDQVQNRRRDLSVSSHQKRQGVNSDSMMDRRKYVQVRFVARFDTYETCVSMNRGFVAIKPINERPGFLKTKPYHW